MKKLVLTCFSRHAAVTMARFYITNFGAELISGPDETTDGSNRWSVTITDTVS